MRSVVVVTGETLCRGSSTVTTSNSECRYTELTALNRVPDAQTSANTSWGLQGKQKVHSCMHFLDEALGVLLMKKKDKN